MNLRKLILITVLLCLTMPRWHNVSKAGDDKSSAPATEPATEIAAIANVSFKAEVAPIVRDRCLACHGPRKAEGGYRMDTYREMLKPGDSGADPVSKLEDVPHELLRRLTTDDIHERMPAEAEALSAEEIDVIRNWLAQGAGFDGADPTQVLLSVIPPAHYAAPPDNYNAVPVTAMAFSPDGKYLITGGYHELLVWDLETLSSPELSSPDSSLQAQSAAQRISNFDQRILALEWLPGSQLLAVACGQPGHGGEIRLLDFDKRQVVAVSARLSDTVLDIAVQPSIAATPLLAVAAADGTVRLLDGTDLSEKRMFASHGDWVTSVAWSPDGKTLASSSKDSSVKVYDLESGQLRVNYQGHSATVRGLVFTVDGQQVISVGADRRLLRWKSESGEKVAEVGLPGEPFKLKSMNGSLLIPCTNQNLLRFDTASNTISQALSGHQDWVTVSAYHDPSGRYASGSIDGEIRLWNAADGQTVHQWYCKP